MVGPTLVEKNSWESVEVLVLVACSIVCLNLNCLEIYLHNF